MLGAGPGARAGGIGVLLSATDGGKIVSVIPGSPADQAGVRAGDLITSVDERPTAGLSLADLVAALRGESGTAVRIGLQKYMGGVEWDISLVRQELEDVGAAEGVTAPVWTPGTNTGPLSTDATLALILQEVQKINQRLDTLETGRGRADGFARVGPDTKRLREIQLPPNPSRKDVEDYVAKIVESSEGQNSFSPQDPQVALLTKVGEENIDLLLDLGMGQGGRQFHVNYAIKKLATEKSRAKIVKALETNRDLADLVLERGWEGDAKQTLVAGLGAEYLPSSWIQAVASFKDPSTYDKLRQQFVNGHNRSLTYDAIKDLPGIQIEKSIEEAWRKASRTHIWERTQMAAIAADYGHKDALDSLARSLTSQDARRSSHLKEQAETALLMRIDGAPAAGDDIAAWYNGIRDRLVFDRATKRFRVQ